MNIILAQLDHIGYSIGAVEYTSGGGRAGPEYEAEGYVTFDFDVRNISIEVQWEATLTQSSVRKSADGFSADFIPRVELTGRSLENFPWHHSVDEDELENWLNEFMNSCRIYDEVVNCLPLPEHDEMELEDCLLDRSSWRGLEV